ncbi:uncharacterized protein KQ657_002974 [Scheffersomyces spartinae]|uniref:non-specific serine/threonine protein kinase n=1 Tax=Scheffersomyces spartinae TaxID=45513 RepID=A0A9P7V5L4_9ASCO|nr:uncharacterized protein KQ657_002974 [Scheffersomyces spartinae]KAG7191581.1 hypothetical protein KQ657_002974 [Scheffersomyces spartinae]
MDSGGQHGSSSSLVKLFRKNRHMSHSDVLSRSISSRNDHDDSGSVNSFHSAANDSLVLINGSDGSAFSKESPISTADTSVATSKLLPKHQHQHQHQHQHLGLLPLAKKNSLDSEGSKKKHLPTLKRFLGKLKEDRSNKSNKGLPHFKPSLALDKKYTNANKLLGSGATGSVILVHSKTDSSQVYAVKQFRPKQKAENERDYKVKVKNEFKIASVFNHPNLIKTYELVTESGLTHDPEYYIVMDYCPYDFFNLVMSGLITIHETECYFKQIIAGVFFLHDHGLAHRDLKLDNCVVTDQGILKLIDFGSAVQFRKPRMPGLDYGVDNLDEDHRLQRARGIVGSDPYLSPEVFEPSNFGYDPRLVDVWSIAIIYCCLVIRRFPWKIPKWSDPSYSSFASAEPPYDKGSESEATVPTIKSGVATPVETKPNIQLSELEQRIPKLTINNEANTLDKSIDDKEVSQEPPQINLPEPNLDLDDQAPTQAVIPQKKRHRRKLTGREKLLRLLPRNSRSLIDKMLAVNPEDRYTMDQVIVHPYVQEITECQELVLPSGEKSILKLENHTHHLVTEDQLRLIEFEKARQKEAIGL